MFISPSAGHLQKMISRANSTLEELEMLSGMTLGAASEE